MTLLSAMPSIDSPLLVAVTTALGIFIFIFIWVLYRFNKKINTNLVLPPGPRPWPVIGNLHLLGNLPHQSLAALAKKYGPLMFLRLGSVQAVVVSNPAMAKEFLKTHDLAFANRPRSSQGKFLGYDHKDLAFASYGEYWRQIRKLCTLELLTAKRLESFKSVREEEMRGMIRSIWEESGRGVRCVDVRKRLASLTLNVICRMFGSRTFSDHELSGGCGFEEMVHELLTLSGAFCVGDFIPSLNWLDLQGLHRRMKNVHKIFDEFAEKVIDEHIDRRTKSNTEEHRVKDLVDVLLDLAEGQSKTTEMQITRVHIKAIISDMLSAGSDTSSTMVEWALGALLRNPALLARTQKEIESVVGRDRMVKESDVGSFEYLRCVMKETFRLHPVAPLLVPHESTEGCSVGRYYIPPKTRLFVNMWAIGRDESVWKDPSQFNPERFIGKDVDVRGQHYELIPFGSGRRGCPGISMGLLTFEFALAQLLHCFDWSVEGEVRMEEEFGLALHTKFPLLARPTWRLTIDNAISNF